MPDSEIATPPRIKDLLEIIDRDRPKNLLQFDYSQRYDRAGQVFWTLKDTITLLCETRDEVCYYQAGVTFIVTKNAFMRRIIGYRAVGLSSSPPPAEIHNLSLIEVELILGILSIMEPAVCWSVLGNDLHEFIKRKKRKLNLWTGKITSLLLTQMLLKTFCGKLYQKLSTIIRDGIWSEACDAVPTDDGYVARLTGYLMGSYESEALMEKALNARCSVFYYSLKTLEALVDMDVLERKDAAKRKELINNVRLCFQHMGAQVTTSEIQSYMEEADLHPNEIKRAIQMLLDSFDNK